ncbi:hypothetical protein DFA_07044 [Cavenderia fasciculata]|uniref:Uncharacterized protein n=1 Tax=Cavenderia fasciculata TaxID=261658 RepID=F4PVC2_CACFS|nr:uncharacterized protein DFA_07044 [Cavenderia fasciculata]EGG19936.1 hypothetical protein DFA_07044 [Cavenderia fasciculata]|eukprot:XP_004366919.1 hypothetical protein DFA_07044 [Cavenderia fasciculata]
MKIGVGCRQEFGEAVWCSILINVRARKDKDDTTNDQIKFYQVKVIIIWNDLLVVMIQI